MAEPVSDLGALPATNGWEDNAACLGRPASLFFSKSPTRIEAAKAICADCLVRSECLAYAMAIPDLVGVFGGLDEHERRALSGRQRRYTPSLTGKRRRRKAQDTSV
jgi:WhiB family redox-sensing transcriptional regulator